MPKSHHRGPGSGLIKAVIPKLYGVPDESDLKKPDPDQPIAPAKNAEVPNEPATTPDSGSDRPDGPPQSPLLSF